MAKITKRTVEAAPVGAKDGFLWDEGLKGFGLKVTPAGRRVYILQYRVGGSEAKTKRFTIGTHGSPWTPDKARVEAERLAIMASQGTDPMLVEKRRRNDAVSLEFGGYVELFADRYLKVNWKASWRDGRRVLDLHVTPLLRGCALTDVTRRDISAVLDRLTDRPATAKLTFATLRKLFRWAVDRGDIALSPITDMTGPPTVSARDRVLSDDELASVWEAADTLGYPFGPITRLLIATGARREEVAALDWLEIDQRAHTWTLPAARAKNGVAHVIPLNDAALTVLGAFVTRRNGLVFSANGTTPPSGFSKAKLRLDKAALERLRCRAVDRGDKHPDQIDMPPFRLHDIRRTVATGLQRLGVRFEVTEAILNHISGARGGVAGVYQRHHWIKEKRAALEAWSGHLESLSSGSVLSSNVVAITGRR